MSTEPIPPKQTNPMSLCPVCGTHLENLRKCPSCQKHTRRAWCQAVCLILTFPAYFSILSNGRVERANNSFFQPSVIEPILVIVLIVGFLILLQRWLPISSHSMASSTCPACGCPSPEGLWCHRCVKLRHTTTLLLLCAVMPVIGFMSCLLTIAVDANQVWVTGLTLLVAPIVGIILWARWQRK